MKIFFKQNNFTIKIQAEIFQIQQKEDYVNFQDQNYTVLPDQDLKTHDALTRW